MSVVILWECPKKSSLLDDSVPFMAGIFNLIDGGYFIH